MKSITDLNYLRALLSAHKSMANGTSAIARINSQSRIPALEAEIGKWMKLLEASTEEEPPTEPALTPFAIDDEDALIFASRFPKREIPASEVKTDDVVITLNEVFSVTGIRKYNIDSVRDTPRWENAEYGLTLLGKGGIGYMMPSDEIVTIIDFHTPNS